MDPAAVIVLPETPPEAAPPAPVQVEPAMGGMPSDDEEPFRPIAMRVPEPKSEKIRGLMKKARKARRNFAKASAAAKKAHDVLTLCANNRRELTKALEEASQIEDQAVEDYRYFSADEDKAEDELDEVEADLQDALDEHAAMGVPADKRRRV